MNCFVLGVKNMCSSLNCLWIFDLFCVFHGTILEGFWGHLEVENRLGDSMGALFSLELDFPGSRVLGTL